MRTPVPSVDLRPDHWAIVRCALRCHVPDREVLAFGSRATWTAKDYSDLDLAVMGEEPLSLHTISALDEALGDSDLPFKVDVVDWARTEEAFRAIIRRHGVPVHAPHEGRCGTSAEPASDWLRCTVAQACSAIDYGLTRAASDRPSGQKFLRITDIVSGQIDWNTVPYVTVDSRTAEKYRLHHDDIVLARTGASTGVSAYIKNPPPAVFASYLVRLRTRPSVDGRFLAYFLRSELFRNYMRGVLGDKSAQPNASAITMTAAPFRVPRDPTEQRAIAHVLGTLDDRIELHRRTNETLEAMARALFKSWFVDFDPVRAKMEGRDTGLPQDIADLFPDHLVDSGSAAIPKGWEVFRLDQLARQHTKSISPSRSPEIEYDHFSIPSHDAGQCPIVEVGAGIRSNKTVVPHNTVLLSKLNPRIPRVWVPSDSTQRPRICSTEFLVFTPRPPANRGLLFALFTERGFRALLMSMVTGTSGSHQRVPPKALRTQRVLAGSPRVFEVFGEVVGRMLARILRSRSEVSTLAALRDALLPKLISGEIRVGDAEGVVDCPT